MSTWICNRGGDEETGGMDRADAIVGYVALCTDMSSAGLMQMRRWEQGDDAVDRLDNCSNSSGAGGMVRSWDLNTTDGMAAHMISIRC